MMIRQFSVTPTGTRHTRPQLESLEDRLCMDAGTSLINLPSGPGYKLQVNTTGRVAVMQVSQAEYNKWANGQESIVDTQTLSKRVYSALGDQFDFLMFVNDENGLRSGAFAGQSVPVKSDISGLGMPFYDDTAAFGSAGKLQGTVHLTYRNGLRDGPSLHELMHRWANELTLIPDEGQHWGFAGVGGQLGGWKPGTLVSLGNGLYKATGPASGSHSFGTISDEGNNIPYSQLELYLMGLIKPSEVTDKFQVAVGASWVDPGNGIFRANSIKTLTINDIIAREGARVSAAGSAQKAFRTAVVVLSPGPLSQAHLDQFDTDVANFSRNGPSNTRGELNFWQATGGRATMKMDGLLGTRITAAPSAATPPTRPGSPPSRPLPPSPPGLTPASATRNLATAGAFDPDTGMWYLRNSNTSGTPDSGWFSFGLGSWTPVTGDWNGDGVTTIGTFDPATATWYLRNSNSAGAPDYAIQFGAPGWTPVAGDWNGDGVTTIGVVDPTTMTWYLRNSNTPGAPDVAPFQYGAPGWNPVVGDWDGNGTTTVGVVDPSTMNWYLRSSNTAGTADAGAFTYGQAGWKPLVGDWDGDGKATVGVVDPGTATWYLRNSNSAGPPSIPGFSYGVPYWLAVSGRWRGVTKASATDWSAVPADPVSSSAAADAVFSNGLFS